MYQILIKHFSSNVWNPYHRPFLTKESAQFQINCLKTSDEIDGNEGVYEYKIKPSEENA